MTERGVCEKQKWLTENTIWRTNIAMVGRKPAFWKQLYTNIGL